jgi:hypothetical protein
MEIAKDADGKAKCRKEGCRFKEKLHHYCGKHQVEWFREESRSLGFKTCANDIRGCRVQNPLTYLRSKCTGCLEKDREIDHQKRKDIVTGVDKKQCSACTRLLPLDQYQGIHGNTKTCQGCRDSNKRADLKRDKERVKEIANKNAAKPERKEVKKMWKENNPEKVASYWLDARKRLIEQDLEGYLKKNAEKSKKWRDANPAKVLENNLSNNENIEYRYVTYKRSAETKRLTFEFNKEEFIELVKMPCYYCGILQEKGFNGIDRLDSDKDYIKDNCVSCCTMCNMMKGTTSPTIFVHRAEHILTYLKLKDGQLYPNDFIEVKGVSFAGYKHCADKRKIPFEIKHDFFQVKRSGSCYLCGKEQTEHHKNGLDRYDNTKGYTEENVRACCWSCNFMKKDYTYNLFIGKLQSIYSHQKIVPICKNEHRELHPILVGNKLTYEEIQENIIKRKEKQRKELKDKYCDDEFRKEKEIDIASRK